jgi:hypothetical protein
MGRPCETVTKTFNAGSGEARSVSVKLFPWEELNAVDVLKKEFGI